MTLHGEHHPGDKGRIPGQGQDVLVGEFQPQPGQQLPGGPAVGGKDPAAAPVEEGDGGRLPRPGGGGFSQKEQAQCRRPQPRQDEAGPQEPAVFPLLFS